MKKTLLQLAVLAAAGLPVPLVQADPGNVRLMLQMVRDRWLMARPYEGQDYLYISTVLPYRCGLTAIRYGLNGAKPATIWPMEPCHSGALEPNALLDMVKFPAYVTFAPRNGPRGIGRTEFCGWHD